MRPKKAEHIARRNMILRLRAIGLLENEDLQDKDKYFDKLKKADEANELIAQANLMFVVDYRNDLLAQAEKLKRQRHYEQAELLLATFFEHAINSILEVLCKRKKLSAEATTSIFRRLTFEDKTTWILELLDAPAFNKKYLNKIISLLNRRNGFVHYKYKLNHDDRDVMYDNEDKINRSFADIGRAVKYIINYEKIVCFYNLGRHIDQVVKQLYGNK